MKTNLLDLGEPDIENFRRMIPVMKERSKKFREAREEAHRVDFKDLILWNEVILFP